MEFRSIGDLAGSLQLSKGAATTKAEISRLVDELTTGIASDTGRAVSGDFGLLGALSADEARLEAYMNSSIEAQLFVGAAQSSLEMVQSSLIELGTGLVGGASTENPLQIQAAVIGASDTFSSAVGALNTDVAGRRVFSGTATDTAPLPPSADILDQLSIAVSGLASASDVTLAVSSWFAGSGYLGSNDALAPIQLSDDSEVNFNISAGDESIQEAVMNLAMAALLEEGNLNLPNDELAALAQSVGTGLLDADGSITLVRAKVGSVEAEVEEAQVQNEYESSSIEIWKNEILGVDEYRAATELQTAETQLQLLYTLTSRLSQMSLAGYL